ncbi:MAG: hypothetical protein KF791_19015 [Verrucomicrobiae bacterium]|nr:hypothetical protein [Verrucomicrobiae bacterium]
MEPNLPLPAKRQNQTPISLNCGIKELTNLNFKWSAAPTIYYVDLSKGSHYSSSIISLSKYVGDNKPKWEFNERSMQITADLAKIQDRTGFKDYSHFANVRQKDSEFYIFDTEKNSFEHAKYPAIPKYTGNISMYGVISFSPLVDVLGDEGIISLINQYF